MPGYNYKTRFAVPVARGDKRQTVREVRKDRWVPRVGMHSTHYTGLRTPIVRFLNEGPLVSVAEIRITKHGALWVASQFHRGQRLDEFAVRDGFEDGGQLLEFFKNRLPFEGHVLTWKPQRVAGTCRECGCTEENCLGCFVKTGGPCSWVDATETLCSACAANMAQSFTPARGERIVVVCGYPRSGTSLAMQMLHASGICCAGEWPAFEPPEVNIAEGSVSNRFVEGMQGGAFKLLDPHQMRLPAGYLYDFVFMRRNRWEQARSNAKFLQALGFPGRPSKLNLKRLARSIERDSKSAIPRLRRIKDSRFLELKFEDLIDSPDLATQRLASFLDLSAHRSEMRACIQSRSAACLDGMLEIEQLDDARANEQGMEVTL